MQNIIFLCHIVLEWKCDLWLVVELDSHEVGTRKDMRVCKLGTCFRNICVEIFSLN